MSTDTQRIRIAIIDDHPMVREGLRSFLQLAPDMEIVAEGATGAEAIQIALSEPIDVMLMDLVMPGHHDGVSAITSIAEKHPHLHMIALTSFQDRDRMLSAIHAGAISYLQKDVSPEDLLTAIRQAAQGRSMLDAQALSALRTQTVTSGSSRASTPSSTSSGVQIGVDQLHEPLTVREAEVLDLLAQGMSNKEIADVLCIAEKTVKVHVSHILGKLGVYDRTQALLAAARLGLIRLPS